MNHRFLRPTAIPTLDVRLARTGRGDSSRLSRVSTGAAFRLLLAAAALASAGLTAPTVFAGPPATPHIATDGSMGPVQALTGPNFLIPQSLGTTSGNNLFHSFTTFNLSTGESATFTANPTSSIHNVFARVTGGTPSSINGSIVSQIPNANLYLVNPAGVMFGAGSSLDVQGSFTASTATVVNFPGNVSLPTADPTTPPTLSGLDPVSFGFSSTSAAPINVSNTTLLVPAGKALNLIGGGTSTITGTYLTTQGGHISIVDVGPAAAVQSASVVVTIPSNIHTDPQVAAGNITSGPLTITDSTISTDGPRGGSISVIGTDLLMTHSHVSNANLGSVASAGNIDISVATLTLFQNSSISTSTANSTGGNINLTADSVTLNTNSSLTTSSSAGGKGGTIAISAGTVALNASNISTVAGNSLLSDTGTSIATDSTPPATPGTGGKVSVKATNLTLDSHASISSVSTSAAAGGAIGLSPLGSSGLTVALTNSGSISTFNNSSGAGGSIGIAATAVSIDGSGSSITGRNQSVADNQVAAGNIAVNAQTIALSNNAVIGTLSDATGAAGTISLAAGKSISVSDGATVGSILSGTGGGNAAPGFIALSAPTISLLRGGNVFSQTLGTSDSPSVNLLANNITIDGVGADTSRSGISSVSGTKADATTLVTALSGPVTALGFTLTNTPPLQLSSPNASITGNAGDINLYGGPAALPSGANLLTIATPSPWANSAGLSSLTVSNHGVVESYTDSAGNAGNIRVSQAPTSVVTLTDAGQIRTFATSTGAPGSITLAAGQVSTSASPGTTHRKLVVQNSTDPTLLTGIQSITSTADAQPVTITLDQVQLIDGGFIRSFSLGNGNAANLGINSTSVALNSTLQSAHSNITTWSTAAGLPGAINITTGTLALGSGSQIISVNGSNSNASPVTVNATGLISIIPSTSNTQSVQGIFSDATTDGNGADLNINAGDFTASGLSYLATNTIGAGLGGNINLTATSGGSGLGQINLNLNGDPTSPPAIVATSNGAFAVALALTNPPVNTLSDAGKPGSITLSGSRVYLDQGAYVQDLSTVNAGSITIAANPGFVFLDHGSHININSPNGSAGDITLTSPLGIFIHSSMLTDYAPNGPGANITLTSAGTDEILNSSILTQAFGSGAQVTIDPILINIQNSVISGRLTTSVNGLITNNIIKAIIDPNAVFLTDNPNDPNLTTPTGSQTIDSTTIPVTSVSTTTVGSVSQSATNSTSNSSESGTTSQSNQASPRVELNFIQNRFLQLNASLQETCGIRLMDDASTFILSGTGGLPIDPHGYLPAYMIVTPPGPARESTPSRSPDTQPSN